jgi:predicted nucleic acid-binding protein
VIVVADSGPLIHLASINQLSLLKRFFHTVQTITPVYQEVVVQGHGRAGDFELRQAVREGWVWVDTVADPAAIQRFVAANVSVTDAAVIAFAVRRKATLLLADDTAVREMARREGLAVMGTVGILVQARLAGFVNRLQPLLDQLIATGFYLEPGGSVYQDALSRAGEI